MSEPAYLANWEPTSAQRAARDAVARAFGVEPCAVVSKSRKAHVVRARQAAVWVLHRKWPTLSWPMITRTMNLGDHSSAIYADRRMEARRAREPDVAAALAALLAGIEVPTVPPVVLPAHMRPGPNPRSERPRRRRLLLGDGPILSACENLGDGSDRVRLPGNEIEQRREEVAAARAAHVALWLAREAESKRRKRA